jgi:hypothetical protein
MGCGEGLSFAAIWRRRSCEPPGVAAAGRTPSGLRSPSPAELGKGLRAAFVAKRLPAGRKAQRSKLDALLRAHSGGEVVLDEGEFGYAIGRFDQFRLGVAAGDDDMQIGAPSAKRRDDFG